MVAYASKAGTKTSCTEKILISGDAGGHKIIGIYEMTNELRHGKPVWTAKQLDKNKIRNKFIFASADNYWKIADEVDFNANTTKSNAVSAEKIESQLCPTDRLYKLYHMNGWQPHDKLQVKSYTGKVNSTL